MQAIKYCIGACYYGVLWDLKTIEERLDAGSPVETELPNLKNKLGMFMDLMKQLLPHADVQMYRDEVSVSWQFVTCPVTFQAMKNLGLGICMFHVSGLHHFV